MIRFAKKHKFLDFNYLFEDMGYNELLQDERWKNFSRDILKRDNYTCQCCKKKGQRNDIYHAISDINRVLSKFSLYQFDEISRLGERDLFMQKSLIEIINFPINYADNKFYIIPNSHIKNLYNIQFSNSQRNIWLTASLTNIPIYSEAPSIEESPFEHRCFEISKITKNEQVILRNLVIYTLRFKKICDTTNGYIKISSSTNKASIEIITSEYYIEIIVFNNSIMEKPSKFDFLFRKLNAHHTLYKYGNSIPWDYDSHTLITLCEECHYSLHKNKDVPIIDEHNIDISSSLRTCDRCNGIGFLSQYKHIENGICFKCRGTKKMFVL